jgi:hypothetical protein
MPALRVSSVPPPKPSVRPRSARAMLSDPPPKPARSSQPNLYSPDAIAFELPSRAALDEDAAETMRVDHLRTLAAARSAEAEPEPQLDGAQSALEANAAGGLEPDGELDLELLRLRQRARNAAMTDASSVPEARLALAAAWAQRGELREAYLEGVLALAAARLDANHPAIRAAAQLLAELTRRAGFEHPAHSWDELAEQRAQARQELSAQTPADEP